MKKILLLCPILVGVFSFAQIRFEPGTFTDNSGQVKEVLINNEGLKSNPTKFEYKTSAEGESKIMDIKNAKSFEIFNFVKYERAEIDFDLSSEDLGKLSLKQEPEFVKETVFLKVLVTGTFNLYEYTTANLNRFYYKSEYSKIQPLVYKMYETSPSKYRYNESYKNQLFDNFKCPTLEKKDYTSLTYKENDLRKIFEKANVCADPNFTVEKKREEGKLNLYIRPRANLSSLSFRTNYTTDNNEMSSKTSFGAGVELEYILPWSRNKFAVIIEPNFLSYKAENTFNTAVLTGGVANANADFKFIDIPVGLRYYLFIDAKSKMFFDAVANPSIALNSTFLLTRNDGSPVGKTEVSSGVNFGLGIGYNYNSKFSLQFRYLTNRDTFKKESSEIANFQTASLILGYNVF